jgi:hypothetical protein
MICRMNKRQRQALINLIDAMIVEKGSDHIGDSVRLMELEEDFHKCFGNESQIEDDHEHAERT